MQVAVLDSLNLASAEKTLANSALQQTGSIVEAAQLLGVSRRHVTRLIVKHAIPWPASPPKPTSDGRTLATR